MSTLSVNTIKDVQSFDFANTSFASAFSVANSGYVVANAAFTQSNANFTRLSASYVVANAAFGKANTALQNTSGTFAGALSVTGGVSVPNEGSGGYYTALNASGTNKIILSVSNNGMATNATRLRSAGGGVSIEDSSASTLLSVLEGGNVGVGTTSPYNKFQVNTPARNDGGTNSIGAGVISGSIGTSNTKFTSSNAIFRVIGTNATNSLQFGVGDSNYSFHGWIQASYDNSVPGTPDFGSKDLLLNPAGGNVGIGVPSPSYGFHHRVYGNAELATQYGTGIATYLGAYAAEGGVRVTGANPMTLWTNGAERMRIDSSGRVTMQYQPAFFAYKNISDNYASAAGVQPFPFTKSMGNHITSNYNASTYTFTAPVAGVYHFDFVIAVQITSAPGDIAIAVNGTSYTNDGYTIIDIGTSNWRSLGISAVIYLAANDAVTAYRTYAPNNPSNTGWRGYFSGYLVG